MPLLLRPSRRAYLVLLASVLRTFLGSQRKLAILYCAAVAPLGLRNMTVYFISRHPGAKDWAARQNLRVDHVVEHLDTRIVNIGDVVIGSLPVNLAADVCARGARYLHLSIELPANMRGKELTAADMIRFGARLEAFVVSRG